MLFLNNNYLDNIYHISAHKAGSQWIRLILSDPLIKKRTKLEIYSYQQKLPEKVDTRKITERFFSEPFPMKKIISPLYMSQECYENLVKPKKYKSFYVYRDPRDLLISYYYSAVYSHPPTPGNTKIRQDSEYLELEKGLIKIVDFLENLGFWESLRSWAKPSEDKNLRKVGYEDLIGKDSKEHFNVLFDHLKIKLSKDEFTQILRKYSFENMSGGRVKGQTDKKSHFRKAVKGDWKEYFSSNLEKKFYEVTNDTVSLLGYS